MKKRMIALASCAWLAATVPAAAQSLPVYNHPQISVYSDPTQWPLADSSQCHWPMFPGADPSLPMEHVHVEPQVPLYAMTSDTITIPVTLGLFNTGGRLMSIYASVGNDDGWTGIQPEKMSFVNAVPDNLVPFQLDLNGMVGTPGNTPAAYVTWQGTITVPAQFAEHGWYWLEIGAIAQVDDGTIVTDEARRAMFSTLGDPETYPVGYGGWNVSNCQFFSAAHDRSKFAADSYGVQSAQFDYLASDRNSPFMPLPLLPMPNAWPGFYSTYGYGQGPQTPVNSRFVLDPNYHAGFPGTTLEQITTPDSNDDPVHIPMIFNQTGTHKYAVIRDLTVPGSVFDANENTSGSLPEHSMTLYVHSATGMANMSQVPQPFPIIVVPPPTPPPPVPTWVTIASVSGHDVQQLQLNGVPVTPLQFKVCQSGDTNCSGTETDQ